MHYVCADDTHGTPIMLRADQEGITPRQLIDRVWHEHKIDFDGFYVDFDNYYTTDSPENQEFCEDIYRQLEAKNLIAKRSVEQFYDPVKEMFLPDRYIKGECPNCHARDQYGDSCEACGATYSPTDLINPYSAVSGSKTGASGFQNITSSNFRIPRCRAFLKEWVFESFPSQSDASLERKLRLQPEAANKMNEWLSGGLSGLGYFPRCPLFRLSDSRHCRQEIFLCLVGRPRGLLRQLQELLQKEAAVSSGNRRISTARRQD